LSVAPYAFLVVLAFFMLRRGLHRDFPAFFCYVIFEAAGGTFIYAIDVIPSVSGTMYWWTYFLFLIVEVFVKFVVIGEVFTHLLLHYPPLGRLAKLLISGVGIVLIFAATIIAAYANPTTFWIISAARILGRSVSVVLCGLVLFLFVFAAHFNLRWQRSVFGIALGFGISASVYLAHWAIMAAWIFGQKSYLLDFVIMATYQVCVLVWLYYFLIPQKVVPRASVLLPAHNLEVWNRELERLIQL
jgi:hypothetical protein